jgi:hypothetical protein
MATLSRSVRGLLFLAALGFARPSRAAVDDHAVVQAPAGSAPAFSERLAFSAAYVGELVLHPGALVGIEYRLAPASAAERGGTRLLLAANFGSYVHVRNHVGLFVDAELGVRHGFRSGVFVDAFAGLGYLHTFLAAPVYEVGAAGHVTRVTDFGRPAFMPVLGAGTGYETRSLAVFLRAETFGQYPFNQHLLPHAAVLVGVRISAAGVSL